MKVLQICSKPPIPEIDGGCIAGFALSRDLMALGIDLQLLLYETPKHPFNRELYGEKYPHATGIKSIRISKKLNVPYAVWNLFSTLPVQVQRFRSAAAEDKILQILKDSEFDAVLFDGLPGAVNIEFVRAHFNGRIVYRAHNIEHTLLQQDSNFEKNPLKSLYFKIQARRLKRFEASVWKNCDEILAISGDDLNRISNCVGKEVRVVKLPYTFSPIDPYPGLPTADLFHIGAMDWFANKDGLRWFLNEVWPLVLNADQNVQLHLAGKDISTVGEHFKANGIVVHEEVEDAMKFMSDHGIMIVPLRIGSGVRIKILQALSLGKAVVSTKKGVEGIGLESGVHLVVVDDPLQMANEIIDLLASPEKCSDLGRNGRDFVEKNHSPAISMELLSKLFSQILVRN